MKTIIIYNTQTGFTERYARWIAEAVEDGGRTAGPAGCSVTCVPLKEAKKTPLSDYDAIIYGGWARAGGISGLGWFKKNMHRWSDKKLIVFCVGGSPADSPEIATALRQNFSDSESEKIHAFYCPGGFNYEKMPAASKLAMKLFLKALKAKKDTTAAEQEMIRMIASSYNISDRNYIRPIVTCLFAKCIENL